MGCSRLLLFRFRLGGVSAEGSQPGTSGSPDQGVAVELQRCERDRQLRRLPRQAVQPFRDQFAPEKLADIFKEFRDKHIDFDIVAAKKPINAEEPKVDDRGVLSIKGHFDTTPSRVNYDLAFILSDGEWKLIKIDVNVKKPEAK